MQQRMLEQLHAHGFHELEAAHLNVFHYPGPQGAWPTAQQLGPERFAQLGAL